MNKIGNVKIIPVLKYLPYEILIPLKEEFTLPRIENISPGAAQHTSKIKMNVRCFLLGKNEYMKRLLR